MPNLGNRPQARTNLKSRLNSTKRKLSRDEEISPSENNYPWRNYLHNPKSGPIATLHTHTNHAPRRENFAAQIEISPTKITSRRENYCTPLKIRLSSMWHINYTPRLKIPFPEIYSHTNQIGQPPICQPQIANRDEKRHRTKKFSYDEKLHSPKSRLSPMRYIYKSHIVTKIPPLK